MCCSFSFVSVQEGDSPLHVACLNGHTDAVSLLLESGADLQATTEVSCWQCSTVRDTLLPPQFMVCDCQGAVYPSRVHIHKHIRAKCLLGKV